MGINEEYELLPHQKIQQLRDEVTQLKQLLLKPQVQPVNAQLISQIQNLTSSVNNLYSLFSEVKQEVLDDYELGEGPSEKLNKLIEQNHNIVESLNAITEKLEEHDDLLRKHESDVGLHLQATEHQPEPQIQKPVYHQPQFPEAIHVRRIQEPIRQPEHNPQPVYREPILPQRHQPIMRPKDNHPDLPPPLPVQQDKINNQIRSRVQQTNPQIQRQPIMRNEQIMQEPAQQKIIREETHRVHPNNVQRHVNPITIREQEENLRQMGSYNPDSEMYVQPNFPQQNTIPAQRTDAKPQFNRPLDVKPGQKRKFMGLF